MAGLILQPVQQRFIRQPDRLERIRATKDGEELWIDRRSGAHRDLTSGVLFLLLEKRKAGAVVFGDLVAIGQFVHGAGAGF